MAVDYSLYLVTDSTAQILGHRNIVNVVEEAIAGGVTIVQFREKRGDTAELVRTASRLHSITRRHKIPLLINDRIDVALAVGAEGVHLGQDDIDLATARQALGKDAIIGATANSVEEARQAARDGADYLGIGTVFATSTKSDTKSIIGTTGLRRILSSLSELPDQLSNIPTVCIGGVNASNVQRILYQSRPPPPHHLNQSLNGIAVVSAIMASPDPRSSAGHLRRLISTPPAFAHLFSRQPNPSNSTKELLPRVSPLWRTFTDSKPLSHNMTNTVVQNFAANVTLAIGASPIMSMNSAEAADLAAIPTSALVLNMGTLTGDTLEHYKTALAAYNKAGRPTLLDPVGGGATATRRQAVRELLDAGHFDVIKGNEAEIRTVWVQGAGNHAAASKVGEEDIRQHGVDSGDKALDETSAAKLVRDLAIRERCVALMTGPTDILSDGRRTFTVKNGTELLGMVTGSGCSLGAVIASFLAVDGRISRNIKNEPRGDPLLATLSGVLAFEIAAENVSAKGPGSFLAGFLDALYELRNKVSQDEFDFGRVAKVQLLEQ